jgi:site-specific recombinase XerD
VNLRWKNVNIAERYIVIGDDEFTTKGRSQRTIPLCEEALKIIMNCELGIMNDASTPLSNREYVFAKENGMPFSGDYISKKFKKGCRLAGVSEKIHFHSLRHSFASNLVIRDVSLYKIKELMGHSSITTTEIYAHLNLKGLRDAVSVFNGRGKKLEVRERANDMGLVIGGYNVN